MNVKEELTTLTSFLQSRLYTHEALAAEGIIPGQQDSYELEQRIGAIKEIKYMLKMLESSPLWRAE